jgi:hypothetical protein
MVNRYIIDSESNKVSKTINYINIALEHASNLLSIFQNFEFDEEGNVVPEDNLLNIEALNELVYTAKKISSKSDVLQSKVAELASLVK